MGYHELRAVSISFHHLNRLDEPVFMVPPKPMQTEFGIHYRLESCGKAIVKQNICFF